MSFRFFLYLFCIIFLCCSGVVFAVESKSDIQDRENELDKVQEEIEDYQSRLEKKERELETLSGDINRLDRGLSDVENDISVTEQDIKVLDARIVDVDARLVSLSATLQASEASLTALLRGYQQYDDISALELCLAADSFSHFLDILEQFFLLQIVFQDTLKSTQVLKQEAVVLQQSLLTDQRLLEEEKNLLATQKATLDAKRFSTASEYSNEASRSKYYDQMLTLAKETAVELEQELYRLRYDGSSKDYALADIVDMARQAGAATGVRPAFLMAILKQESNLGTNTGTAHYKDAYTCNGAYDIGESYVSSQIDAFKSIAVAAGRDPESTLVSACPGYGMGGAMGPAQFMPLTWRGYEERVRVGANAPVADPWNLLHAMIAMSSKLSRDGATAQTREAEHSAALIYFSGSVNHKFDWYADSVLELSDQYAKHF